MASEIPRVSVPYSGPISWLKDVLDSVTRSDYFKTRDEQYCLKLCDSIQQDVQKLNTLKKKIEDFFYTPREEVSARVRSSRPSAPPPYAAPSHSPEDEEEESFHPNLCLYEDKAQEFADKYFEFKNLFAKVTIKEFSLNNYLDNNHNISDELWAKSSPLSQDIAVFKNFQNEKRAFCPKLDYIPPGKNIQKAVGRCLNTVYTHGMYTPSRDFFNYIETKTGSKVGAVAVLAFGIYGAYQSYNFVTSDYMQISSQVLFWTVAGYSIYQISKFFKQNAQEKHSEITLRVTASKNNGTPVRIG